MAAPTRTTRAPPTTAYRDARHEPARPAAQAPTVNAAAHRVEFAGIIVLALLVFVFAVGVNILAAL